MNSEYVDLLLPYWSKQKFCRNRVNHSCDKTRKIYQGNEPIDAAVEKISLDKFFL